MSKRVIGLFFFFSSRRRHTRWTGDWSSDVCSSDLEPVTLAWWDFEVRYTGRAAHASAFPELGINAADALTIAQTAIGLLRQHIRQSDRIHGIVTDGGDAPNVVPAHAAADYIVRARALAAASTDMGNVSQVLPSIHPMIGIASLPAVNHQPEFTATASPRRRIKR